MSRRAVDRTTKLMEEDVQPLIDPPVVLAGRGGPTARPCNARSRWYTRLPVAVMIALAVFLFVINVFTGLHSSGFTGPPRRCC
jgi:hypothetical protein